MIWTLNRKPEPGTRNLVPGTHLWLAPLDFLATSLPWNPAFSGHRLHRSVGTSEPGNSPGKNPAD